MKRFTECTKWTQNKWFRTLATKHKLFWLYLLDTCDSVGVWEEDIELASFLIAEELNKDELLSIFQEQVKIIKGGKKWWIHRFIEFQYGVLDTENIRNRPHQSYIKLLKYHSLWLDYEKTIHSLKEKDKEKDKDKDKDKEQEKDNLSKHIIFVDEKITGITDEDKKKWQVAYPAVDIDGEIKRAELWLVSNPKKRKKNVYRFLVNWFARSQEKGGSIRSNPIEPTDNRHTTFSVKNQKGKKA